MKVDVYHCSAWRSYIYEACRGAVKEWGVWLEEEGGRTRPSASLSNFKHPTLFSSRMPKRDNMSIVYCTCT